MGKKVYSDGKIHVLSEKCQTCVFRSGNLMDLQPGRLKGMVDESLGDDSAITCHATLYDQADQQAVCRGFYDSYADRVLPLRMAAAMDIIEEVPPPKKEI